MKAQKRPCLLHHHYLLYLFLYFLFISNVATAGGAHDHEESNVPAAMTGSRSVPALYVFGDSYVDPGNNNYIFTTVRFNYGPYGHDFTDRRATGRSSNGRIVTDFLASYLGIKETVPPYLDPKLGIDELKTGVSFASAGSGFDPIIPSVFNLIGMPRQANYFKEYKTKLESAVGKEATEDIIEDSLFFVNCGINDIVNNYFRFPIRPYQYTVEEYHHFLISRFQEFIQTLLEQGARKFAIAAVPPMGCAPTVIDRFSENSRTNRSCIEKVSSAVRGFNQLLKDELKMLQVKYDDVGAKFMYMDQYEVLDNIIQNPEKYGFDDVSGECCTSKLGMCLSWGIFTTICPDASKYVFWDFIHLTEKAAYLVFDSYRPNIDLITSA